MRKYLYLDLETTGTEKLIHGVHQIAGLIELDGKIKNTFDFRCRLFEGQFFDEHALELGGVSKETIDNYPEPEAVHRKLCNILKQYVDIYNPEDKFTVVAYNAGFDIDFLSYWFGKNGDNYLGSLIDRSFPICILSTVRLLRAWGDKDCKQLENSKLSTVCKHFGIPLDPHDAMKDIIASRKVYSVLLKKLTSNFQTRFAPKDGVNMELIHSIESGFKNKLETKQGWSRGDAMKKYIEAKEEAFSKIEAVSDV